MDQHHQTSNHRPVIPAVDDLIESYCAISRWWGVLQTYVRDEGHLQHAGLQPFEVNGAEDGMGFDLRGSTPLTAQPLCGIFGQQLQG